MTERDEFEKALAQMILKNHPESGLTVDEIKAHREGDEYKTSLFSAAWWAWQEAAIRWGRL